MLNAAKRLDRDRNMLGCIRVCWILIGFEIFEAKTTGCAPKSKPQAVSEWASVSFDV